MQTYVLLMVGIFVSGVEVAPGNAAFWLEVIPLIILGGIVFASLGLAVSGLAKTENTAAPLANIISLPMMFLSGVFIPHSVIPDWVVAFARWLPLTFLADGMRAMVNSGETFFIQGAPILGLARLGRNLLRPSRQSFQVGVKLDGRRSRGRLQTRPQLGKLSYAKLV